MEVIDALAHAYVASEISKHIDGFSGFYQHYIDEVMTTKQRQIWSRFMSRVPEIKQDMARQLKGSE
jgi:hypothetical protein